MGKIADALKALIENSEDLSSLPQLVAQVETLEASEEGYQNRIAKLQEVNRNYLAQIPIPNNEPEPEPEDKEPTLEDAKQYLESFLGGNK